MRVVVDTNVVASAVFFGGVPAEVLRAWGDRRFEIVVSPEILGEYERIMGEMWERYPTVNPYHVLDVIRKDAEAVEAEPLRHPVCRDPDDDKFIACALACRVPRPLIVSGDRDLLALSGYRGIEVVRPRELLARLAK